jgi:hypothetical protein
VPRSKKALTGLEKRIAEGKLKDRDKMLMRLAACRLRIHR